MTKVNLDTLQPMPGEAIREGLSGASDLTFRVNLRGSEQTANLHVGVLLEHKSYEDYDVLQQLMKYYFEVILQKAGNIPLTLTRWDTRSSASSLTWATKSIR